MVRRASLATTVLLLAMPGNGLISQTGLPASDLAAIRSALDRGNYTDAERIAAERVQLARAAGDAADAARASDLLVEALTRGGKIGEPRTVALAESLIAEKTALFGSSSTELASSLDNLGSLSTDRGEFGRSIALHQRALTIRRSASDDPALADTLERLALPMIWLERFAEAQKVLDEARRIREQRSESAPLDLAHTLYLEALLHRWDGHVDAATDALNRAQQTRLRIAPNHPDNIGTFELKGDLLFFKGDVRQAEVAWNEALQLAERTLGPAHPSVPPLLHRLAIVAQELGDLDRKRTLLERGTEIARGIRAPCYSALTAILNNFGTLSNYLGDFQQARTYFREALTRSRKCWGATHSATTSILHNQAALAADMGDFVEAEELYRQVLRAWTERLGPNHPFVAGGLDSLADVVSRRGRNVEATQLLERALRLRTGASGANSPEVAATLVSLARTVSARGDSAAALAKVDQAIAIYQEGNRPQDPDSFAAAHSLRGTILFGRRDYEHAREAFATALAERDRVFGAEHPLSAASRAEVASADFALGALDPAIRQALEAEAIGRNHLRFTIRYLPERQALAYADKRPRGLDLALSGVASSQAVERDIVLDAVVRSRGLVLDELGARAHLTSQTSDPVLASLNSAATAARERFANLMMRSVKGEDPVPRAILDEARTRKEEAERALAERSVSARADLEQANVGLKDVRAMLPAGSALVAFVRYSRLSVPASTEGPAPRTTMSYVGFVIRSDADAVDAVQLGPASTIDNAVTAWREQVDGRSIAAGASLTDAERSYRNAGSTVRRRIWDPVAPFVHDALQVFVVPDGAINFVSFGALPTGTNRYLIEGGPLIHYLSTERDIIARPPQTPGRGLLAVGGPAYDDRVQSAGSSGALRAGCASLGGLRFEDLPGSRLEAAEISKIWSASAEGPADVRVLSGRGATKTTVKQEVSGRRVIHLATHGFFLQSPCDPAVPGTRAVGGLAQRAVSTPNFTDNPLLLSGLAFAGANSRTANRRDDGILTAEEVAGLNLQGTEWAVLSACDTGTGQVRAGEGIFGLRRAFQIAGVRTIIMSLWSVEDRSTQIWMRYLYDARFNRQLSTAAAVRAAGLRALEERRSRRESTHPFFWAAFVAAGDWR